MSHQENAAPDFAGWLLEDVLAWFARHAPAMRLRTVETAPPARAPRPDGDPKRGAPRPGPTFGPWRVLRTEPESAAGDSSEFSLLVAREQITER